MHIKYYYNSNIIAIDNLEANRNLDDALYLLNKLKEQGHMVERIDTFRISEVLRSKAYADVIVVAVLKKSRIRQVFGSRRISGTYFGKQVPAIVIYDNEEKIIDAFPRKEMGSIVTIAEGLRKLINAGL
ncbi:MAG: hypothetical protein ACW98Y_09480 [Candidatus Thorarchaeota archaeon]|jgi:hypothetical protein